MSELRLQIRPLGDARSTPRRHERYRMTRPNGWHCQHWHSTPEAALGCVTRKMGDHDK